MYEKDFFKKALEASKQKGLIITNADPDSSGIEEGHFHIVSTEGKLITRINLNKLKADQSQQTQRGDPWLSIFKNGCRLIFYGSILYACSPIIHESTKFLLSGIGDESALYICKTSVASEANRLFGPIGGFNIEGQINEDSLDMISFFFTVKKELYKASCHYPEPYSKYNLVIKIEKED